MEKVQLPTTPYPLASVPVYERLRDEFAMAALTGILAARPYHGTRSGDAPVFAAAAYTLADAMLKQREAS
jgi:hypothetical protein